ncbi:hypothetical protein EYS14_03585 [Alteromonadaceae bacterium M269]|nr:hypothetical protein EYS14_03585 [Alteromonadaceae bacterium M269]
MEQKPIVNWQSPDTTPEVGKGKTDIFWIAVNYKREDAWHTTVFDAQYVNKPLEFAEDDTEKEYPLDDDCFFDMDGDPIESIGWYRLLEHADFNGYYEPITFRESYVLLGWAKYQKPEYPGGDYNV